MSIDITKDYAIAQLTRERDMWKAKSKAAEATCRFAEAGYESLEFELNIVRNRAEKAEKTLRHAGYTDEGGEMWKPPLGPRPDFSLLDQYKARAEALERALRLAMKDCNTCVHIDREGGPCSECSFFGTDWWQFDQTRFTPQSEDREVTQN